jgi:hypothetical protein
MQSCVMSFKKAVFGWPFYAAWNLSAYACECRRSGGSRRRIAPLSAALFLIFTTGAWAALWLAVFRLLMRLAKSLSVV